MTLVMFWFVTQTNIEPPSVISSSRPFEVCLAILAHQLEIEAYPRGRCLREVRSYWLDVKSLDTRMWHRERFPVLFEPDGSVRCYMQCIEGINRPARDIIMRRISQAEDWVEYDYWCRIKEQNDDLYRLYDLLDDLYRPNFTLAQKRVKLVRIRELLGEEAYEAGKIPAASVFWKLK
jgi:hypothetical protein